MITHTPLVAGNLPIKTLVARQRLRQYSAYIYIYMLSSSMITTIVHLCCITDLLRKAMSIMAMAAKEPHKQLSHYYELRHIVLASNCISFVHLALALFVCSSFVLDLIATLVQL